MNELAEIRELRSRLDRLEGALLHADKLAAEKCRADFDGIMAWLRETFSTNDPATAAAEVSRLRRVEIEATRRYADELETLSAKLKGRGPAVNSRRRGPATNSKGRGPAATSRRSGAKDAEQITGKKPE